MRSDRAIFLLAALAAVQSEPAFASGDPAVLLIPAGHLVLVVGFLALLGRWRSWGERLTLSLAFFGSLAVVYIATAGVPFERNSHWLLPAMLAAPLFGWGAAALLLRRRLQHGRVA